MLNLASNQKNLNSKQQQQYKNNKSLIQNRYQKIKKIGEGSQNKVGNVYKGKDNAFNQIVAIKQIKKNINDELYKQNLFYYLNKFRENGIPLQILRECAVLKDLEKKQYKQFINYVKICRIFDVIQEKYQIYIIMEFVDYDLCKYLSKYSQDISLLQIKANKFYYKKFLLNKEIQFQIFKAIHILHIENIIHRDLKPQNILINNKFYTKQIFIQKQYKRGEIKICDFGMSRQVYLQKNQSYSNEILTLQYRAPELLLGSNKYSFSIDIWSLGCIFAEILLKQPLFSATSQIEMILKIFQLLGTPINIQELMEQKLYNCQFPKFKSTIQNLKLQFDSLAYDLLLNLLQLDVFSILTKQKIIYLLGIASQLFLRVQ